MVWLNGFNIRLELHSELLPTIYKSQGGSETYLHYFDPSWMELLSLWQFDDMFAVAQITDGRNLSYIRSLRRPIENFVPPKYWPRSLLLHFRCSNEERARLLRNYSRQQNYSSTSDKSC